MHLVCGANSPTLLIYEIGNRGVRAGDEREFDREIEREDTRADLYCLLCARHVACVGSFDLCKTSILWVRTLKFTEVK